jgi:glutamate 5-kinase
MKESVELRRQILNKVNQVVIKVGTRLLGRNDFIKELIEQIVFLRDAGKNVILVSSGAVGTGMNILNLKKRPARLSDIQALAAIGQSRLMSEYEKYCRKHGFHAAQLLLTADDLRNRERHVNIMNCINSLWSQGNLPIINENDSVSINEIKFGDNDTLAALAAVMTRCELTILLTTVNGLYSVKNGSLDKRISVVDKMSDSIKANASGTDDASMSIGGMTTKLTAAEIVTSAGESLIIADGRENNIIRKIFSFEDVGTLFMPELKKSLSARKRWITFFSRSSGKLFIDNGAKQALVDKGCSLLPSGIKGIEGVFSRGATVKILDMSGRILAKGLSNYSSDDILKILGHKTSDITSIIGPGDEEVVHRNNMVIL